MSHLVVKIFSDDLGEPREKEFQFWHLVTSKGGNQTFCEGEFFGRGESGCKFKIKEVEKGGITCPSCLNEIKEIKRIKL